MSRNFWSKWKKGRQKEVRILFLLLQPSLLPVILTQRHPGCSWQPSVSHTDCTQHILPPWSHRHSTRLPCILIFLSSHRDITAAPSECRWRRNLPPEQDKYMLTGLLLEQLPCCSEPFPFAPSGVEKMKARTSEDLRQSWRIKSKTAGLKPTQ